jgi:hypothetical protein
LAPLLPTYVRRVNLGEYDRTFAPLPSKVDPRRHFIVNDAAFDLVADRQRGNDLNAETALSYVATKWGARLGDRMPGRDREFSKLEIREVEDLAFRLHVMLSDFVDRATSYNRTIPGVGRLESIEVDFDNASTIGEVKSGSRPFRSIDFRQLILSCVVEGPSSSAKELVLLNPREGTVWHRQSAEFLETISLMPFSEFIGEFRYVLTDVGIST